METPQDKLAESLHYANIPPTISWCEFCNHHHDTNQMSTAHPDMCLECVFEFRTHSTRKHTHNME